MSLELIQKIREKGITEVERSEIYSVTSHVSKETREEVCPALFHVLVNSEVSMKNELGREEWIKVVDTSESLHKFLYSEFIPNGKI